ncbi:hypothetical protein CB1_000906002 [Camelus ferus]|nr:hypothetical protein CB1_000906002 [Camelus ferus]
MSWQQSGRKCGFSTLGFGDVCRSGETAVAAVQGSVSCEGEFCMFVDVRDELDVFYSEPESYAASVNENSTLTTDILQDMIMDELPPKNPPHRFGMAVDEDKMTATVSDPKMNMIHLEFFLGIALSWAVRVTHVSYRENDHWHSAKRQANLSLVFLSVTEPQALYLRHRPSSLRTLPGQAASSLTSQQCVSTSSTVK